MMGGADISRLSVEQVAALADQKGALIVDIRPPFDFFGGHIPRSHSLPGMGIVRKIGEVPPDTTVVIVGYDQEADGEIASAAKAAGFADVSVLEGGYDAWEAADLAVETIADTVLISYDRL